MVDELPSELDEDLRAAYVGLIDRQRARLQAEARPLGARLFSQPTASYLAQMAVCWAAWHAEGAPPTVPPVISPGD